MISRILWYIPHMRVENGRRGAWWGSWGVPILPEFERCAQTDAQALRHVITGRVLSWVEGD
jgi:hypothetical protein